MEPTQGHVNRMVSFSKFRQGEESEIFDMLRVEKESDPNRIPYMISFSSLHKVRTRCSIA